MYVKKLKSSFRICLRNIVLLFIILFVSSVQALELEAMDFFFCFKRTAMEVESRTIRVHKFSKENKCAVVYSVAGQDEMVSQGRWLAFCEKKAQKIISNLQKGLWECNNQKNQVDVFYSFEHKMNL